MSDAYADFREPSENYIKAMMYVVQEYNTELTQQQIYDITHTLIMSGFYTGIERNDVEGHVVPEGCQCMPRGTVSSHPRREPVLMSEKQYEAGVNEELGSETSGPFSEALEQAKLDF